MDLYKDEYIIVEVIPTRSVDGYIAQISALKLKGIELKDRFDYRLEDKWIDNEDLLNIISYDKKDFTYVNNVYFIIEKFKQWAKDLPLLLIDDTYTLNYLEEMNNKKELVYPYLELEKTNDVFNIIMDKYKLQPSNHLVDLIYEAIIYEGNNKKQ
ncbi:MAG: hypothetical protein IKQ06_00200 [Bacilli bacterium]|nr:hypothetical protein [Bacilli bacterium]